MHQLPWPTYALALACINLVGAMHLGMSLNIAAIVTSTCRIFGCYNMAGPSVQLPHHVHKLYKSCNLCDSCKVQAWTTCNNALKTQVQLLERRGTCTWPTCIPPKRVHASLCSKTNIWYCLSEQWRLGCAAYLQPPSAVVADQGWARLRSAYLCTWNRSQHPKKGLLWSTCAYLWLMCYTRS